MMNNVQNVFDPALSDFFSMLLEYFSLNYGGGAEGLILIFIFAKFMVCCTYRLQKVISHTSYPLITGGRKQSR